MICRRPIPCVMPKWRSKISKTTPASSASSCMRYRISRWKGWTSICHWFPKCQRLRHKRRHDENWTPSVGSRDPGVSATISTTGFLGGLDQWMHCANGRDASLGRASGHFWIGCIGTGPPESGAFACAFSGRCAGGYRVCWCAAAHADAGSQSARRGQRRHGDAGDTTTVCQWR